MEILKKIAKLIDVKSIVTLIVTVVFAILSLKQVISSEQFLTIFTVIIGFYFGTQYEKASNPTKNDEKSANEPSGVSEE